MVFTNKKGEIETLNPEYPLASNKQSLFLINFQNHEEVLHKTATCTVQYNDSNNTLNLIVEFTKKDKVAIAEP